MRQAPVRWQVVMVALFIGWTWAWGATLPLGSDLSYPPAHLDAAYYERVVVYSLMLIALAPVAWLVARLAPSNQQARATAWAVAVGAVAAAFGNLLEDGLGIADASMVYGLGLLFGLMLGLIGLTVALAVRREVLLTVLVLLTLAGLVSGFGHGPPLMPTVWLGVAAWVAVRGLPRSITQSATKPGSSSPPA